MSTQFSVRGWPGDFLLRFDAVPVAAATAGTAAANASAAGSPAVSPLLLPLALLPCSLGEVPDWSRADNVTGPGLMSCVACRADQVTLWTDERQTLQVDCLGPCGVRAASVGWSSFGSIYAWALQRCMCIAPLAGRAHNVRVRRRRSS
jgi:hypothetical protein